MEWLKEQHIRFSGKALGRSSKISQSPYQKRKFKKEQGERNHIEGKFGQGKNGYNLNKIRARRDRTSESWIACILFVMNLVRFAKDLSFGLFYSCLSVLQMLIYKTIRIKKSVQRIMKNSKPYKLNVSRIQVHPI